MIKKVLLKTHQVLGSVLSLAFVVWFISGFFMIFSGFPHAPGEKLLQRQAPIKSADSILSLSDTLFRNAETVVLEKFNDRPVYRINYTQAPEKIIDAASGTCIDTFSGEELDAWIARNYEDPVKKKVEINDFDAWIPWSHYKKFFPIVKYFLDDSAHTVAYVSVKTGKIVQETTRKKRWLARFGAIPHWYYFKSLRLKRDAWIRLITWVSGMGSIMSLTGIILGFYSYRRNRKKKQAGWFRFSPYKKTWYKWHHVTGFIFGIFVFTFVFSGMMSLQDVPKAIVPVKGELDYKKIWNKDRFEEKDFKLCINDLLNSGQLSNVKKIAWNASHLRPCYFVYQSTLNRPTVIYADNEKAIEPVAFLQRDLEKELHTKFPDIGFTVHLLSTPDSYYHKRKNKIWPVYKVEINDEDKTWLYVNPSNLEILKTYNQNTRTRRWLYKGLHSFDFKVLNRHEWLRKSLLILLSVFGTIVSISGLVLAYRYARRKSKKIRR